jgi:hypothetical protein
MGKKQISMTENRKTIKTINEIKSPNLKKLICLISLTYVVSHHKNKNRKVLKRQE